MSDQSVAESVLLSCSAQEPPGGGDTAQPRFRRPNDEEEEEAAALMLSVSSRLAEAETNVMSTASKVVLGVSVVLTVSTVTGVHFKQTWDRQVGLSEPKQP